MTDSVGSTFHGYHLIEPLGDVRGCNAFKATTAQGDEIVAIKIFPPEVSRSRPLLERLRKSFQSVDRLKHPRILPVISFSVHQGRPYIVMPYMDAGSLKERIEFGALVAMNVEVVIGDLVSALEAAHSKGLIHGNLKPSHVLFDEDGNVQLNGIGEAPLARVQTRQLNVPRYGSFDYRAPEVKAGGDITPQADQYSLGLIALQLLTRLPIEDALAALEFCQTHDVDLISRPSKLILDLPKRMIAVLSQALSKDPSKRFPSLREMYQSFVGALHNKEIQTESQMASVPDPKSVVVEKPRRNRLVILGPILALALCLIVAIPAFTSQGGGPLSGLISALGLKKDVDVVEVTTTDDEIVGGIDLGTEVQGEKDTSIDEYSIKPTDVSGTPEVSETSESTANDPPSTSPPPVKTDPPKQPSATQSSPEQPTATATPTSTATASETEAVTPNPTFTEPVPTDTPTSDGPINPNSCKKNPGHHLYCTPTPSP